jgi:bacteriorhodopsin
MVDFTIRVSYNTITNIGCDWNWPVTGIMVASTILCVVLSPQAKRGNQIFHYITVVINLVSSITYYMMASKLGVTPVTVKFSMSEDLIVYIYRQVFYVRYIDWLVTTPVSSLSSH